MGKKLKEVKEFDTIIGNSDYENNPSYICLPENVFQDFIAFIHEYEADKDNADILEFIRIGYKRNVGETVTLKNYVGLIQMRHGYQIEVLPKICFGEEGSDEGNIKTKRTFLRMLRSMRDFPSKVFNDANLKVDKMNLYEVFINMYISEARQLVKHGIKSSYVRAEDNLRLYKGKLQVGRQIRENCAHKERFCVSFDEFHANRPENRIVKATLEKLIKLTASAENAREIRRLLLSFDLVESSTNYQKDFSSVVISRNTREYESLMQWSKVFLLNKSFTTFSGNQCSRALLFPMESVYESFVAQQIKKLMSPDGWKVTCQDKGYYLFVEPRAQFKLKPDIVLRKEQRVVILDTKWKKLIDNKRKNYGISQADMYQMYAYSKKYKTPEIWLLYPVNDEMRGHDNIYFDSGDGTSVKVFFVDVDKIDSSLSILKHKIETA